MDLKQLRYFVAIIQCGSITRASLQLYVAQPALSLHIRNMEADLGVPLLFRTSQGVQPTEAGVILLRNAQIILAQFEQAETEIKGSTAEPAGGVRLGLPSSISQILGVPLILAARERQLRDSYLKFWNLTRSSAIAAKQPASFSSSGSDCLLSVGCGGPSDRCRRNRSFNERYTQLPSKARATLVRPRLGHSSSERLAVALSLW